MIIKDRKLRRVTEMLVEIGEQVLGIDSVAIVHIDTAVAEIEAYTGAHATLLRASDGSAVYRFDGMPQTVYVYLIDYDYVKFCAILRQRPRKRDDLLIMALMFSRMALDPETMKPLA